MVDSVGIDSELASIPGVMLQSQSGAATAPGAGYYLLRIHNGVLEVAGPSGTWQPFSNPLSAAGSLIVGGTAGALDELAVGDDSDVLTVDPSTHVPVWAPPAEGASALYSALAIYEDQKSTGTNAGTATQGSWETRTLNTEVADPSNIGTLSGNAVTLAAGTYELWGSAPGANVGMLKCRLYDVTAAAAIAYGRQVYCSGAASYGYSDVHTVATFGVETAIRLEQTVQATSANTGMGWAASFSVTEVYARLVIRKLA